MGCRLQVRPPRTLMASAAVDSSLRCLLIEDEPRVTSFITQGLTECGHSVVSATDGEAGLALAEAERFSVVILDIGLPGTLDGLDVAVKIREQQIDVPILMLTARDETQDVLRGFEAGADDYVMKPFDFLQFEARLRALARRSEVFDRWTVRFGPLELDSLRGCVLRDGCPLSLTPKEFRLLTVLIEHSDRTVSREQLLELVWGIDFDPGTRLIDVHIANLRRKLEAGGYERLVQTVRGVGFRAVAP